MTEKNTPNFVIIPSQIMLDNRLTLRHIKVLIAICSWRKSNTNLARISRQMISERTGYLLDRVSTITTELVELGWLKKSGNLGKKQWSKYEIQDLDLGKIPLKTGRTPLPKTGRTPLPKTGRTPLPKTGRTPLPKTGRTPLPKTGRTPLPKTGRSIDTEVIDTEVIDTERKHTKKKETYREKVKNFVPTKATADTFKKIYPNLKKSDYLELIDQFKDHALNRKDKFKDFNAGMRNYLKYEFIKPVNQSLGKSNLSSFRAIGDTMRQLKSDESKPDSQNQMLIVQK